jgi:hypothetical protein
VVVAPRGIAEPDAAVAVAGPGVDAAVAGRGVAVIGVAFAFVFVDAAAGFPVEELWPAGSAILELDPAGHGAMFWPTARVAETRNKHNHIKFVFKFIKTSKAHFGFISGSDGARLARQPVCDRPGDSLPSNLKTILCATTDAVKFVPKLA